MTAVLEMEDLALLSDCVHEYEHEFGVSINDAVLPEAAGCNGGCDGTCAWSCQAMCTVEMKF